MSDPVLEVLRCEADRRVQAQHTPPVAAIHARSRRRSSSGRRRQLLLPAGAVAAVVLTALVAQHLVDMGRQTPPLTIPKPPTLGVMAPPQEVGARMGADYGHLTGEPVSAADVLAVSPPDEQGRNVRTYGQLQPRSMPDAQGRATAYRCVLTQPDSGPTGTPVGQCQNVTLLQPEARREVAARVEGVPEATFITGTAPPGTAAVRLEAPGREPLTLGTSVAGPKWADTVYFTAWWPRAATTVTAYDKDRRQLGQTQLPDPEPRRTTPDDSELGVLTISADEFQLMMPPEEKRLDGLLQVDVLNRLELAPNVTRYTVGILREDGRCIFTLVRDHSGTGDDHHGGGGGGCGPTYGLDPGLGLSRSFGAASGGHPASYSIQGSAPAGTAEVIVTSAGQVDLRVPAYSGGIRWQDRTFFAADLTSNAPAGVRALAEDGRTLATSADKGMDLKALEPSYLEAYARCLEADGITVTRHPQGGGSGPAYEYDLSNLAAEDAERLEASCNTAAEAATS